MSEQNKAAANIVENYPICDVDKFKNFVEEHIKEKDNPVVAIFTHKTPDPDAIGCMMGLRYLFENYYNISARMFTDGDISHPQNVSMVQLLDPPLESLESFDASQFSLTILVDTVPCGKVGCGDHEIDFDIVIDHHKELPANYEGFLIHYHTGSCGTIIFNLLSGHGINFNRDNDLDAKTATGILVGIITDTNFCLSADSITPDWMASQELAKSRDEEALDEIIRYERPMSWVRLKALAINEALENGIEEGIAVLGLGILKGDQRDVLSDIAEDVLTWKTVHTAVVFALFDGDRIEGAIRTRQRSTPLAEITKKLGGKPPNGSGGARGTKGGYVKYLGSMAIDSDEPEELKVEMWEAIKKREVSKVLRTINK